MKKYILKTLLFSMLFFVSGPLVFADPVVKTAGIAKKNKTVKKSKTVFKKGFIYVVASQQKIPLMFSRAYTKSGKNIFTTTYSVYNDKKQSIANIRATHNKTTHVVEVVIRDFQVSGNPVVNSERTTYASPYMGRFGSIGKVGAGAGRGKANNPGQMIVKFINRRFDYVQVVSVADAHEDSGKQLQVYVLDEQSSS
jgi:hypothetical protein